MMNIGFSSIDSAERSKELLEKLDFDYAFLGSSRLYRRPDYNDVRTL